jgi:hypothetical protein
VRVIDSKERARAVVRPALVVRRAYAAQWHCQVM